MKAVDMKTHGDVVRTFDNEKLAWMVATYITEFADTVFEYQFEPEAQKLIKDKFLRDFNLKLQDVADADVK